MGYVCYLKEANEQTTAASITQERERESEREENERDEEEKGKGALLVLIWASVVSAMAQYLK